MDRVNRGRGGGGTTFSHVRVLHGTVTSPTRCQVLKITRPGVGVLVGEVKSCQAGMAPPYHGTGGETRDVFFMSESTAAQSEPMNFIQHMYHT